jgi:hypothetical protein
LKKRSETAFKYPVECESSYRRQSLPVSRDKLIERERERPLFEPGYFGFRLEREL